MFSRTYLRVMMPGINLSCCNGDITLAYKYITTVPECNLSAEEMQLVAEQLKKKVSYISEPTRGNVFSTSWQKWESVYLFISTSSPY